MPKSPAPCPPEFRRETVGMVRSRRSGAPGAMDDQDGPRYAWDSTRAAPVSGGPHLDSSRPRSRGGCLCPEAVVRCRDTRAVMTTASRNEQLRHLASNGQLVWAKAIARVGLALTIQICQSEREPASAARAGDVAKRRPCRSDLDDESERAGGCGGVPQRFIPGRTSRGRDRAAPLRCPRCTGHDPQRPRG
jgi:hypothetical protein